KFSLGEFAVLVLVALVEESWREKHPWAEATTARTATTSAEPASPPSKRTRAAIFGFHGLPLFRRKLEVDGPDIGQVEEVARFEVFSRFALCGNFQRKLRTAKQQ